MSSEWEKILGCAHAWYVDGKKIPESSLPLHWLDDEERALVHEFSGKGPRQDYLVSRTLCRGVLSHYTEVAPGDWRFTVGKFGKPRIAAPRGFSSLRFNLTHTTGLIVCLVSRAGEVGVDAEKISRRVQVEEIAEHFFAKSEWDELAKLTGTRRTRRFFEIWALKEAYLKGRGRGFSMSPRRAVVGFDSRGRPRQKPGWQLALHEPRSRYVAATAVQADKPIPIVWKDGRKLLKA